MPTDTENIAFTKDKAEGLYNDGKLTQALSAYAEISEAGDLDPGIFLRIAEISEVNGDKLTATRNYELAACAYARIGKIANAISASKVLIKLAPESISILDKLTDFYMAQKPDAAAVAQAETAVEKDPFKEMPLFSSLPREELLGVIKSAIHLEFAPNETVFNQGEEGRSVYVITSGEAEVVSTGKDHKEVLCSKLGEGDFFGEIGYFSGSSRSATVRAVTELKLLEFTRKELKFLTDYHRHMSKVLFDFYRERVLDRYLAVSKIFKNVSKEDREKILDLVWSDVYVDEMDIVTEGDVGEEMYLIKIGTAEAWTKDSDGTTKKIAKLKEGDCFGQLAMLHGRRRQATVTALTDVELVVFSRPVLEEVLNKYPAIATQLENDAKDQMAGIEFLRHRLPPSST